MCRPIWSVCAPWRRGWSSRWAGSGSRSRRWNGPPGPPAPLTGVSRTPGPGWGRRRRVSAERARAELAGGMRACAVCRPDTVLNRP
ncbi:DUF6233 domain-containing protein [Streptomyces sp. f150]|uniref:DUF6233 domain-containing protein n=1 Tax=Streptomyces sp. f150 TaxID=1827699 RepID=UPI0027B9195C|nr:DUF6233 domain-containing protein [Streptomyces sp. f150]